MYYTAEKVEKLWVRGTIPMLAAWICMLGVGLSTKLKQVVWKDSTLSYLGSRAYKPIPPKSSISVNVNFFY